MLLEGKYQRKIAWKHKASINCINFWIVFIKNISYDTVTSSKNVYRRSKIIMENVFHRVSIRKYEDKAVEKEKS